MEVAFVPFHLAVEFGEGLGGKISCCGSQKRKQASSENIPIGGKKTRAS